jgi:hypothetical protein
MVVELFGYVNRILSGQQSPNWTIGPYVAQTLLILVAPALFSATIYMILGRIILYTGGEKHSLIREKWLTKIFVTGDVLSFLLQAAGGGILAEGTNSSASTGKIVVIAGLALQIIFFGFFVVVALSFHKKIAKDFRLLSSVKPIWRGYLYVIYIASALILIRSIFRIAEFSQGFSGYLLSHEVFIYCFDALPMFFTLLLFNIKHPHGLEVHVKEATEDDTAQMRQVSV